MGEQQAALRPSRKPNATPDWDSHAQTEAGRRAGGACGRLWVSTRRWVEDRGGRLETTQAGQCEHDRWRSEHRARRKGADHMMYISSNVTVWEDEGDPVQMAHNTGGGYLHIHNFTVYLQTRCRFYFIVYVFDVLIFWATVHINKSVGTCHSSGMKGVNAPSHLWPRFTFYLNIFLNYLSVLRWPSILCLTKYTFKRICGKWQLYEIRLFKMKYTLNRYLFYFADL